jgi:hypothetical protein
MSAGIVLIDYDGDGWPDIYFTDGLSLLIGSPQREGTKLSITTIMMATFTDVTDKAGVGRICDLCRDRSITERNLLKKRTPMAK